MYTRTQGAYIAMVELTHAFHARTMIFSESTSAEGERERGGEEGKRGEKELYRARIVARRGKGVVGRDGSVGGGRGVMSIIGFNIDALGKPVYKYPYATVITT